MHFPFSFPVVMMFLNAMHDIKDKYEGNTN